MTRDTETLHHRLVATRRQIPSRTVGSQWPGIRPITVPKDRGGDRNFVTTLLGKRLGWIAGSLAFRGILPTIHAVAALETGVPLHRGFDRAVPSGRGRPHGLAR